ncbi:MAG: T9SS type A sorting domain-containing protein, partial [Bacteroidota bacterium]
DILLINRHILAIQELASPYQHVVADVTMDGDINVLDVVHIRMVIMGQTPTYPNAPSWRFADADYDFGTDQTTWAGANFDEVYNVNDLPGDILGADFFALEMGNVSEGALSSAGAQSDSGRSRANLTTNNQQLTTGKTYTVAFTAKDLYGFQGTLELTAGLELVDVDYGQLTARNVSLDRIAEGLITLSYDNPLARSSDASSAASSSEVSNSPAHTSEDQDASEEVLFSLIVRATRNAELNEVLRMTDRITLAEAYPVTGGVANLGLDFGSLSAGEGGGRGLFALEQNTPNPFRTTTQIAFNLPEAGTATLLVQDAIGRMILVREIDGAAGYNQLNLEASDLNGAKGVLTYSLTMGDQTATRRMIVD